MDRVRVPTNSELKRAKNIFFPEDIQETPYSDSPTKKLLPAQPALPDTNVPGQEGVDKEAQPLKKDKPSEDSLTIRNVVLRAKEAESRSKAKGACSEATDPEKNATKDKAQIYRRRIFLYYFAIVFHFCGFCHRL